MLKKVLIALLIIVICGCGVVYYMLHKPADKVEDHSSIAVAAGTLVKEFSADEKKANEKYLNKVIEVSGTVSESEKNQDGGVMIVLETGDPMAGIQCAMRDKTTTSSKGQNITIKGFCSGSGITGISLTDCVIKK